MSATKRRDNRRLLTTAQAVEYLSVSRRKLESWVQTEFIPVVRLDDTIRRFDVDALDEIIEANTRTGGRR